MVKLRDGTLAESTVKGFSTLNQLVTSDDYDIAWLKSKEQPDVPKWRDEIRMVDLFSGTGPMTLGVVEAGRATGINVLPVFAIDFERNAAMNYSYNFPGCHVVNEDILKYVDGELGEPITKAETDTLNMVGHIDMVIGGPPCQGHSDLNNHTRRNDPRNQLIFRVVRFVELTRPRFVIIENVQGIRHDKNHVLQTAEEYLERLGYHLHENLLMASKFGVAQNRRRFILVATLDDK
jgi:DNA (cytosine-5)-methyltransferase 1